MADQENLFADFSAVSKEKWLAKVKAELKGKALESLNWSLYGIDFQPFFQREDVQGKDQLLGAHRSNNDWKIGEDVLVEEAKAANKELLESLANGVEAPYLQIKSTLPTDVLSSLLNGVRLDFIEAFYELPTPAAVYDFATQLSAYARAQKIDLGALKGGIFSRALIQEARHLAALHDLFPCFQWIRISIPATENPMAAIAQGLHAASQQLRYWGALGWSIDQINSLLQFSIAIDKHYFAEIAKIRALKLVWANILQAFGASQLDAIYLEARLATQSQMADENQNMINATTQSMSAALAGVNCLNVLPADHFSGKTRAFTKRIARNVQHLLKMESYLDQVADPAAGSYYIENLTQAFFERIWEEFVALEEQNA